MQVTIYRGLDPLLHDATGKKVVPGGTQRIDTRWGAKFIQHLHGKIIDGVLTTEPADIIYPWATFCLPTDEYMRAARLRLKLTPSRAEGLIGGYADIETWYLQMMKSWSTHHQSYGQTSARRSTRRCGGSPTPIPIPRPARIPRSPRRCAPNSRRCSSCPGSRPPAAVLTASHPAEPYRGPARSAPAATADRRRAQRGGRRGRRPKVIT